MDNNAFWTNVDGCLVVNLDVREDRWNEVKNTLDGFIPEDKFERLSAVYGKAIPGYGEKPWFRGRTKDFRWAGRAGCTLSHRKVMKEGLRRGWNVFLVLEDDICLRNVSGEFLNRLNSLIFEEETDWDMCYLGYTSPRGPARTIAPVDGQFSLCQIRGARTTHAYLVKAPLARWLVKKLPKEKNIWSWCAGRRIIDRWYSRHISHHFKIVCTNPSFIIQAPSYSDLVGKEVNNWDESKMVTSLPKSMCDPSMFMLRWWYSGVLTKISHIYDIARGWIKCQRGF